MSASCLPFLILSCCFSGSSSYRLIERSDGHFANHTAAYIVDCFKTKQRSACSELNGHANPTNALATFLFTSSGRLPLRVSPRSGRYGKVSLREQVSPHDLLRPDAANINRNIRDESTISNRHHGNRMFAPEALSMVRIPDRLVEEQIGEGESVEEISMTDLEDHHRLHDSSIRNINLERHAPTWRRSDRIGFVSRAEEPVSVFGPSNRLDAGSSEDVPDESNLGYKKGQRHRFIEDSEADFFTGASRLLFGWLSATPRRFQGSRNLGRTPGSYLLDFTLPDRPGNEYGDNMVSIELLTSRPSQTSSFGAVMVRSPFGAKIVRSGSDLVVTSMEKDGAAFRAGIRKNDIIRAASVPDQRAPLSWDLLANRLMIFGKPQFEQGLVFFEDRNPADFDIVLKENTLLDGDKAEIVLVIERPLDWNPLLGKTLNWGNVPEVRRELGLDMQFQFPWASEPPSETNWQGESGKQHRFIDDKVDGPRHNLVPLRYSGVRDPGQSQGTYRLGINVPDKNGGRWKLLEFLSMSPNKSSSFGAVRLRLPFELQLNKSGAMLVVSRFPQTKSNATSADLRKGDIIRAISLLEPRSKIPPFWRRVPQSEEGLVFLDGLGETDYVAVLRENQRRKGESQEVILVIERPLDWNPLLQSSVETTGALEKTVLPAVPNIEDVFATLKADLPALLDREPKWENFVEGFRIIEAGGNIDGIDGKQIITRLRRLNQNAVTGSSLKVKIRISRGFVDQRLIAQWKVELKGFKFPFLPVQPFSNRPVSLDALTTFTFNERNLVEQIKLDKWLVNGKKVGLPPGGIREFFDWAMPILNAKPNE